MKTLVVTGASRGLGLHIANRAIEEGYNVIGLARQESQDNAFPIYACDVSDPKSVKSAFKKFRKQQDVYGLVNAAGIASMNLFLLTPAETIQKIINTNLLGTMYCSAEMGRILVKHKRGRIINFSTIAVPIALKGEAAYVASKAGVEGFSRTFAREMADHKVTVNVVAPGPIDTDLIKGVNSQAIDEIVERQIIQEKATPEDVWAIVKLLLSDDANAISGEVINVKGA